MIADEQKKERERNREENHGLDSSNPFMNAQYLVTNCGDEGQDGKLRADITAAVARPIALGAREMETRLRIVPCDRRDVALPPAPLVVERLVDSDQSNGDGKDRHDKCRPCRPCHGSPLDKASQQSQSSS